MIKTQDVVDAIGAFIMGILLLILVDQLGRLLRKPIPPQAFTINIEPDCWRVLAEAREITRQAAEDTPDATQ